MRESTSDLFYDNLLCTHSVRGIEESAILNDKGGRKPKFPPALIIFCFWDYLSDIPVIPTTNTETVSIPYTVR